MSVGTNRLATRRRSREEIIELFRACAAKLNGTPGKAEFERTCGISETDIRRHFWKSDYTELAEAAGLPPNTLTQRFEEPFPLQAFLAKPSRVRVYTIKHTDPP